MRGAGIRCPLASANARSWLRFAVDRGFINHPFLAEHDPFLADLRHEPDFRKVLDELRPRWEAIVEWEQTRRGSNEGGDVSPAWDSGP